MHYSYKLIEKFLYMLNDAKKAREERYFNVLK